MPSLFRRMSRYPPRRKFNATENQHTEALAAVLAADPNLARSLAAEWLDLDDSQIAGGGRVATQVPAHGLDRVDLELRFGAPGRPDLVVWVEVKVDSDLSDDDQLQRYWKALLSLPSRAHALVLLQRWDAKRPAKHLLPLLEPDRPTAKFVCKDWQQVARHLAAATPEPFAGRLASDFVRYLTEGGLAVTDPLSAEHLVALEHFHAARGILDRVVREAASALRAEWPAPPPGEYATEQEGQKEPPNYWWSFDPPSDVQADGRWLEFGLTSWTEFGDVRFGVGYVADDDHRLDAEASQLMAKRGFIEIDQDHQRFYRFKHPAELLAAGTLDGQVDQLREWADQAFDDVVAALRTATSTREPSGSPLQQ